MIRNMTLGQYYQADSILHHLDPRVKLLGTLLFVISLFFPRSFAGMAVATLFLAMIVGLSQVPLSFYLRGIKPLLFIIAFSAIMNLLFTPGEILLQYGPVKMTKEGIILAVYLVIRLLYLITGSSVMTFTTTPNQLTAGLEKGLRFLNVLHIPVHELAMMMSIALRFIPILTEELDKIMKAQMSRGADFESGNLLTRARKLIPVLVPLFVAAIRRANDLALAMEARCYHGGEGRSRLYPLEYQRRDYLAFGVLLGYMLVMVVCGFIVRS